MHKIATPAELHSELRRLIDYSRGPQPSRVVLASALAKLAERVNARYAASPDLETQFKEHSAHKPRIKPHNGFFVVEAYSPVERGYIPMAEWKTKEQAERDLKTWEESWAKEQANFKAALK